MKFNDLFGGFAFLALAGLVAFASWNLPNPSQQPLGPSAFPLILSGLLALCAALLAISGARATQAGPLIGLSDWARSGGALLRLLLVPAAVIFYMLFAETLGFLICATAILVVLFLAGHTKPLHAVGLSLAAALVIHSIFYLALGVQLPWGPLEPLRW
ncbi:Tripartite tricarboxylate transporter TctB family protein [Bosea lupini]|jgi:putative tricarboxylic transport membrane protein|uniref:Tripartite tricarboxylate transporter TctB family protein n=1 Tax=Bosea lupini TaxID=1036779 RepID=A0A1H7YCB0_9HYPH|nr:tripartite tricarboxylate transporter TctB family protein [Bosea lupini]SEM43605.1 Tripartite tricarboxylate transporter TctB family protein [Bosea lupini]